MSASRRDFEAIAASLHRHLGDAEEAGPEALSVFTETVHDLADALAGTSPRFDRSRFLSAVGTPAEDEDAERRSLQHLIDTGDAWRLEGSVGRLAMAAIESGACVLGHTDHVDFWGNHVPSRTQVEPGTKGSVEYAEARGYEVLS